VEDKPDKTRMAEVEGKGTEQREEQ